MKKKLQYTQQINYLDSCNRELHEVVRPVKNGLFYFTIQDKKGNEIMSAQIYLNSQNIRDFVGNLLLSIDVAFYATIYYRGFNVIDIYKDKPDSAFTVSFTDDIKERYPHEFEELPF